MSLKFHRGKKTSIYSIGVAMKGRCNNPNNSSYQWYGARGI